MYEPGRIRKPPLGGAIGAVLAGGAGRRLGGAKATVPLSGRPLISHPLQAMREALEEVVIVAKPDTLLPALAGVEVWVEPAVPRHPLAGILEALARAGGRAVVVCAADMPLLSAGSVRRIALADPGGAPAVIAAGGAAVHPLLGCYQPAAAELLGPLREGEDRPLRSLIAALGPRLLELEDPDELFNVNTYGDLERAEAILRSRPGDRGRQADQPNVKS